MKIYPIKVFEDDVKNKSKDTGFKSLHLSKEDIVELVNLLGIDKSSILDQSEKEIKKFDEKLKKFKELKLKAESSIKKLRESVQKLDKMKKTLLNKINNKVKKLES